MVNSRGVNVTIDPNTICLIIDSEIVISRITPISSIYGAVAQWYSQCTSVLEVAGSIPAPVVVELL